MNSKYLISYLGLATAFGMGLFFMFGCSAEQLTAFEPIINPDGALDTLLNTPVVSAKDAAAIYFRDVIASGTGGITIGTVLGFLVRKRLKKDDTSNAN